MWSIQKSGASKKKFLGLPYLLLPIWPSIGTVYVGLSLIDFEIHLSGQDAKTMRMVPDFSLSLLMFKGMGEDWSDKVFILV